MANTDAIGGPSYASPLLGGNLGKDSTASAVRGRREEDYLGEKLGSGNIYPPPGLNNFGGR